jgi:hypothetical protein
VQKRRRDHLNLGRKPLATAEPASGQGPQDDEPAPPPAGGTTATPEPASEETTEKRRAAERAEERSKTRFKITLSVLIALTSLLGALAAWQAETASMKRDAANGQGFANSVANQQAQATIRGSVTSELLEYERARSDQAQAVALRQQAKKAAPADASRLRVQAALDADLATKIIGTLDPDAFGPGHVFDPYKEFEINYTNQKQSTDFDSTAEFAIASRQATKADRLVGLTVLLIAAAFFLTLAQVSSRRATANVYLGGGVAVLVTSTVLLVLVVVAT